MHIGSRHCSRCGMELTDAASMEAGIGPICRKMDNYLLATMYPANLPAARDALYRVQMDRFQDVLTPTFVKIEEALHSDAPEFRSTVKRIEWILSHPISSADRAAWYDVVTALGYIALVSMWKGEAASGQATITFDSGRIYFKGPRNKAGAKALKTVKGYRFHGTSKMWSFPVTSSENLGALGMAISIHWPNNTGVPEAFAAACAVLANNTSASALDTRGSVAKATTPAPQAPEITITDNEDGTFQVCTQKYNPAYVADLKGAIPYKSREWSYMTKGWRIAGEYREVVVSLLNKHFPGKLV